MNLKNYKVDAIILPWVFLKDSAGELIRVHRDVVNDGVKVRLGNSVVENLDGTYSITGNLADSDCVGGVCPIK